MLEVSAEPDGEQKYMSDDVDARLTVCHTEPHDGLHVCAVSGDLDLRTAPELARALENAQATPARSLVFDLSRLRFLSAGGVRLLLAAARDADRGQRSFALVVDTEPVRRLLRLVGVPDGVGVHHRLADAMTDSSDSP